MREDEAKDEGGGTRVGRRGRQRKWNAQRQKQTKRKMGEGGGRNTEEGREAHRGKHAHEPQKRAQSPPSAPHPARLTRRIGPCAPVGPRPEAPPSQYIYTYHPSAPTGPERRVKKIVATHQRWPVRGDGLDWDAEWEDRLSTAQQHISHGACAQTQTHLWRMFRRSLATISRSSAALCSSTLPCSDVINSSRYCSMTNRTNCYRARTNSSA